VSAVKAATKEGIPLMNHIDFALAHPVFDPETQIVREHF
jgi:hypothetical protein